MKHLTIKFIIEDKTNATNLKIESSFSQMEIIGIMEMIKKDILEGKVPNGSKLNPK